MSIPLTTGIERTDLQSMEIGDYISYNYDVSATGVVGAFSNLGSATGNEIPTTGIAIPNATNGNKAYMTKVKKGMLISNSVVQTGISWDTLNNYGMIEGTTDLAMPKLDNPIELPINTAYGVAFSPDGNYMTVAHATNPFISIYKRSGDVFTKLANPLILPTGNARGVTFSLDNNYMSVAHDTTPFITIYKITAGDVFTKLANPATLPTGNGWGVKFSTNGDYLSISHVVTPFVTIYKRNGDIFTKLANPIGGLPTSTGTGIDFSIDSVYMALSLNSTPFIAIYKRDGDIFTKITNPTTLPTGIGNEIAFSLDNLYLSIAHAVTPFISIYKRNDDTFTKLANPSTLPTGIGNGVAFSSDNKYMSVAHNTTPFVSIYKITTSDVFTKLVNPVILPNEGTTTAFSTNGNYIAIGASAPPYITIYKRGTDNILIRSLSGGNSYADYSNKRVVSLCLHGDGVDGSTVFTDSSPIPKIMTRGGDSVIKTDNYKFGTSSMYFDGVGDYIDTPANSDFNFGSDDFTIDFWLKRGRIGVAEYIIGQCNSSGTGTTTSFLMSFFSANTMGFNVYYGSSNVSIISTNTIIDTTNWHHIVGNRFGSNLFFHVDGIQWGTGVIGTNVLNSSTNKLSIGRMGEFVSSSFQGYIDEVRIVNGKSEYTSNFTPPTQPYDEPINAIYQQFNGLPLTNEWEQFIVNSTLNKKITKGDNSVWNYTNISSWSKERPTLAINPTTYRIKRGGVALNSATSNALSSLVDATIGFRPVLNYVEDGSKATNLFY